MAVNSVQLLGRLTADPEVKYHNDLPICTFTLAVNRVAKKAGAAQQADFIRVVFFGKAGEAIGNSVSKGDRLFVAGSIRTGSFTGKDGIKRYTTDIIGSNFDWIESKTKATTVPTGEPAEADFTSMGTVVPDVDF